MVRYASATIPYSPPMPNSQIASKTRPMQSKIDFSGPLRMFRPEQLDLRIARCRRYRVGMFAISVGIVFALIMLAITDATKSPIEREIDAVMSSSHRHMFLFLQCVTFATVFHFVVVFVEKTEAVCDGL
jgi:hypothetical protein